MNKFILCVMDRENKTKEELEKNYTKAAEVADTTPDGWAAVIAATALNGEAYTGYLLRCLDEYFEVTGEDRADYKRELKKQKEK